MQLVEGWEYDRLLGIYKRELKRIKEDSTLSEDDKKKQTAIVTEQIRTLRESLIKKIKKPKYDRVESKENTNKMIKDFEEGR